MSRHTEFPTEDIWQRLDTSPLTEVDWFGLLAEDVQEFMATFGRDASVPVIRQKIGRSVEGRALETWRFGNGRKRVLVWARQHGDEPECTAALLIVLRELARNPNDPICKAILDNLDLLVFPTVNPDGMNRCTRQNAMGIDLNREAQYLSQPEGRALVKLKDDFAPEFSFNLHDMCSRKAKTGRDAGLISVAFQAGPYDETNNDNDVRLRAKTVIGEMFHVAKQVTPQESICVYKAYYMNRAFGDSMMRWGVPCVLIESGSWHADQGGIEYVIRLHALSLLAGLYFVAIGADEPFNNDVYESIPYDVGTHEFDTLFRGGRIIDVESLSPRNTDPVYRADIGVWTELQDFRTDKHRQYNSTIRNVGDITEENAADQREITGSILAPGLIALTPELASGSKAPTADALRPWLEAGITTLAAAFGPFADDDARESFLASAWRNPCAANIIAFEHVAEPRNIIERLAMTPFHGFALTGRSISAADLIAFDRAVHGGDVTDQANLDGTLALDLFLVPSVDPAGVRLVLALAEARSTNGSAASAITANELIDLARTFRIADKTPAQSYFVWRGIAPPPSWLPVVTLWGVPTASGSAPRPTLIAQRIAANHSPDNNAATGYAFANLSYTMAQALGIEGYGSLRQGSHANIALFDESLLSAPQAQIPGVVMMNGNVVVDTINPAGEVAPRGLWHFSR